MAVTNLAVFARRMDDRAKSIPKNVHKIVRSVALAADKQIVTITPVDEGTAKSNWLVSLNVPIESTRSAYSPGKAGSKGEANIQSAISHAEEVINSSKPGDDVWIVNNLPYIAALNGSPPHSHQAPSNFVELSVQAGIEELKRAKVLED